MLISRTTILMMWAVVIEFVPGVVANLFVGPWSDKVGPWFIRIHSSGQPVYFSSSMAGSYPCRCLSLVT